MHLPFETDRLRLRAFRAEDAATFSAYRSEPEVARYQGWSAPFPLEKARTFINKMMAKTLGQPGEWYQIAIERKEDGQMMGDCTYYLADDNRQAEIGFTLAGAFQGQGYAREAVACLIAYLFDDLQVHRVFANVDPANDASIRLLTHLGFRCEGCFRQSMWLKGEWVDEQWYAMLREEWLAARDKGEKSG
jgi:RimJ/RimL family protein N-acetyltransferase